MTSYLQRLAARATGHSVASSLRPIVRSSMSGESDADPFASTVESHELPVAQAPHAEETPQPAVETQHPSPESQGENRQSLKMDYRASPKEEPRRSTNEAGVRTKPATTQTAVLEEKNHRMPGKDESRKRSEAPPGEQVLAAGTRIDHAAKPFANVSETGDEGHADRSKGMRGDASQQIAPRTEDPVRSEQSVARVIRTDLPSDSTILGPRRVDVARTAVQVSGSSGEPAQTHKPRSAAWGGIESQSPGLTGLNEETATTLEPRAAAVPPAAPIPGEPRLVIGQLRVDVVSSAQPREVVRAVTRTAGPGRSSNTGGSLSKLRFGLGQM